MNVAIDKDELIKNLDIARFYNSILPHPLKTNGRDWVTTKCVFHDDRSPSMGVNVRHGGFICHGCGEKGDLFSFYMKYRGVDFKTALEEIANC